MTQTSIEIIQSTVARTLEGQSRSRLESDLWYAARASERGGDPPDTDEIVMREIWGAAFANPTAHYITPYYVASVTSKVWGDITHTQRIARVSDSFDRLVEQGELRVVGPGNVMPTVRMQRRALDV